MRLAIGSVALPGRNGLGMTPIRAPVVPPSGADGGHSTVTCQHRPTLKSPMIATPHTAQLTYKEGAGGSSPPAPTHIPGHDPFPVVPSPAAVSSTGGDAQDAPAPARRVPQVVVDQVAVEVHRHRRGGMPEDPLHHLRVGAGSEPDGGAGVRRSWTRRPGRPILSPRLPNRPTASSQAHSAGRPPEPEQPVSPRCPPTSCRRPAPGPSTKGTVRARLFFNVSSNS